MGTCTAVASTELTVLDPRNGDTVARLPVAGAAECADAIARADRGGPAWARTPPAERAARLSGAAAAVGAAIDELAELNERETGKPRDDALDQYAAVWVVPDFGTALPS
ncbi:MAG: succinate-semialdehyde dehydrogenase / glutarate-semialdehyde dehydrogenase [Mycobacterium sp.]|nr:succinate-semialdehyde dehydrogenase / glutarate-semialdehyde dehydrogenase [Mycobacterium sp.]